MRQKDAQRFIPWLAIGVAVATLLSVHFAAARPGGGSSYSGGGRSGGGYGGGSGGGGGGSGGGGELILYALFWLLSEHPLFGIPLLILAAWITLRQRRDQARRQAWSSAEAPPVYVAPVVRNMRREIDQLRAADENFSLVLFEDFLYALYAEIHTARGRSQLARYSVFFSPQAAASMRGPPLREVKAIVIGAMTFVDARGTRGAAPEATVRVRYQSNYTEVAREGGETSYYAEEEWTLSRKRGAKSRTPDKARVFACPACGAPLDAVTAGRCAHCGNLVSSGEFDWIVRSAALLERTPRGPMLTGDTKEAGNDEPTLVDPDARDLLRELLAGDPNLTWEAILARISLIFSEFQVAWSARDLGAMRPFLSDRLFEVQRFWVEAYTQQRLRNVSENARILEIELARVSRDRFFDALTVRLWATGLDYTIADDTRKIVSGSRSRERRYSEYWTLVRSASKKGGARADRVCPNCGAPLAINMAGVCTYCQVKVTAGDFDWVLSRIEQDEVYAG
jgi:predicted lipid-binding transport protein (Tim44 family)